MSKDLAPKRSSKKTATTSCPRRRTSTSKEITLPLPHQLEAGLWFLNHEAQFRRFKHLTGKWGKVVGFRIQTSKDKDKRISVSWLIKSLLKSTDSMYITLNFDTWSDGITNFNELLKNMCNKLEIKIRPGSFEKQNESLTETIAEKIFNKIKKENRDVILIFAGVDEIPKLFLDQLQALWKNLVTRYKTNTNNSHHLLMFWIDFQSSIDWRDSYTFPERIPQDWQPYTVLNLNIVDKFQRDDLELWVKSSHVNHLAEINYQLVADDDRIRNTIDGIWRKSDEGKPKALLKAVYDVCEIVWEEHEDKWRTFH